jgi:hypothetical protein
MKAVETFFLPFCPQVDWMATSENTQCPTWVDEIRDIFSQDLTNISPGWLNPPWFLIPRVLGYLQRFPPSAQVLACLPYRPEAPWWPLVVKMKVGRHLLLVDHRDIFLDLQGMPLPALQVPLYLAVLCGAGCSAKRMRDSP